MANHQKCTFISSRTTMYNFTRFLQIQNQFSIISPLFSFSFFTDEMIWTWMKSNESMFLNLFLYEWAKVWLLDLCRYDFFACRIQVIVVDFTLSISNSYVCCSFAKSTKESREINRKFIYYTEISCVCIFLGETLVAEQAGVWEYKSQVFS